jgi:hypothetical protein
MTVYCAWCLKPIRKPNYVSLVRGQDQVCRNCYKPGIKDNFATIHSDRVVNQQKQYGADFVQPQIYDKTKRKLVINPQFVSLYPDKVGTYFSPNEIKKAGMPRLSEFAKKQETISKSIKEKQKDVEFSGSRESGIKRLLQK